MINGSVRHGDGQHFLEAHCLSAELQVRMTVVTGRPVFVFHRVRYIFPILHQVRFAHNAQGNRPEWNAVLGSYAVHHGSARPVNPLVDCVALQGEDVLIVGLFPMDERTLPGAVAVVLQGRQQEGLSKSGSAVVTSSVLR